MVALEAVAMVGQDEAWQQRSHWRLVAMEGCNEAWQQRSFGGSPRQSTLDGALARWGRVWVSCGGARVGGSMVNVRWRVSSWWSQEGSHAIGHS